MQYLNFENKNNVVNMYLLLTCTIIRFLFDLNDLENLYVYIHNNNVFFEILEFSLVKVLRGQKNGLKDAFQ